MSRHLAEVARTADEHVGGHLSRSSHQKNGERGIAGKSKVWGNYSCCAAASCEIRAESSGKMSQLEQEKRLQEKPGSSQNQPLSRNMMFMEWSKHTTLWTSITEYAMHEKVFGRLSQLLINRIFF